VPRRRWIISTVVLVVWTVAVLVWAFQPLADHVPTGVVISSQKITTQLVTCAPPIDFGSNPVQGEVPTLSSDPVPDHNPDVLAYQRTPCAKTHSDAEALLILDLVGAIAIGVFLVWRRPDGSSSDEPTDSLTLAS
jgi:hypothetical protein